MSGLGGSKKRETCVKCGGSYPSNRLPQHQDQCSGDPLVDIAQQAVRPLSEAAEFVWAQWDHKMLHAVAEEQIATSQESFCEESPRLATIWLRASGEDLGFERDFFGGVHELPKCERCEQLTRGLKNITMQVSYEVAQQDKRS